MMLPIIGTNVLGAALISVASDLSGNGPVPHRFGLYYSGPPCAYSQVDRTFSQFQVNLDPDRELLEGRLGAAGDGRAVLEGGSGSRGGAAFECVARRLAAHIPAARQRDGRMGAADLRSRMRHPGRSVLRRGPVPGVAP